ncbi:hypothetical protein AVEN_140691-1 [Araneus ventricosus]|uniref:Uncharacterized protein n=1 Tax=Araneus ventricosus TaxID=182803 RepID=A0A4Y2C453_ARAVE|nr:hypothetical protein AVEN_140691-1 [Araneus ventricosus]
MINKRRATSDEGNQLQRLQLRSGKTAVISTTTTTEACTSPMRGGFTLLAFSLSVWVLVWSSGNEERHSYINLEEWCACRAAPFQHPACKNKIPPAVSWQSER